MSYNQQGNTLKGVPIPNKNKRSDNHTVHGASSSSLHHDSFSPSAQPPFYNPNEISHSQNSLSRQSSSLLTSNLQNRRTQPAFLEPELYSNSPNEQAARFQPYVTHNNHNSPNVVSSSYMSQMAIQRPSSEAVSTSVLPNGGVGSFQPAVAAPTTNLSTDNAFSKPIPVVTPQHPGSGFHPTLHSHLASSQFINPQNYGHLSQSVPNRHFGEFEVMNRSKQQPFNPMQSNYQAQSPQLLPQEAPQPQQQQNVNELDPNDDEVLNIAEFPIQDLLLMLSSLLQQIVEANDLLHPGYYKKAQDKEHLMNGNNKYIVSVLAFHGRNIPTISLHDYLKRILKYCPATNDVFLSLLVYFDRIAKRANAGEFKDLHSLYDGSNEEQAFVMDSYNIHRLIIAGITVASKFFSDVFYKNNRYGKVGGLPLEELNYLELQFLMLLDFKLMIKLEELYKYGNLLLKFWKREQLKKKEKEIP
ncbi:PHO85 interacting cyclin [Komagataella phaffii CBS 7435]|uniref:Pho85p cyclin of the Pho80p subfamily, forms a functional kinase complex with Pho85p n=2 Tax=Komagataella phaffii TaxID=460519 RepID=C4QXU8_KOMPG|nr:Pho85p cyclin of the Pho80p subfamily, forms a functional kinase complex with Pho85p [Komagataella phaffii GS115]AOA61602.1 GQ67_01940T0 [Komagataella phaffii]CAH2446889.1 PHO85 interacting cyclin [Komagataella phaffii CBS 7435]AOA65663.1 GQ68_01955T0 [Komagataella phaffii GS115]CAY68071.1 Pho85p cyclin of the Pho80p subfamily, forms a functional kinase complex with Pho85p [Komagataella phaffii GS115]CCA37147.1 PHO85 interacting cyclin [Komagataella phaffii CBS 7435]